MSNLEIAKAYINAVQTGDQIALGNICHPNVVWQPRHSCPYQIPILQGVQP
ncbi:hypothetical protein JNO04_16295 [Halomonas sp. MC140]|nr:hypothetical protein [Halomonas sp. MC140]MDN7133904.1 hypothetical protein [Halomonas sp. MC140]